MSDEFEIDQELDPKEFEAMEAGLQELLSPLASRPANAWEKQGFAARVLESRVERRQIDRFLWIAAACTLLGMVLWNSAGDSIDPPRDSDESVVVQVADLPLSRAFEDGSMIRYDEATEFEVLMSKGPTESLALESGRLRLELGEETRVFVRVGRRSIRTSDESTIELSWLAGRLEVEVLRGEAEVRGPRSRRTLVAGARCNSIGFGSGSLTRLSTPRLSGTTPRLVSILEKFDRRPAGEGQVFPFDFLANAAETQTDTYALWCLLDLAEDREWEDGRNVLEKALVALAGSPPRKDSVKTPVPTIDAWRRHLAPGW